MSCLRRFGCVWALGIAALGQVTLGTERILSDEVSRIAGKRVGLVTNPSGVDRNLISTADRLAADRRFRLVRLFGPEHGIRGDVNAGDKVGGSVDARTGLPVESLYGAKRRPSPESLSDLDALLSDIQDVGSRTYTYASTLGECLHACADAKIPLIVLDRPNPQGGLRFEGSRLEPEFRSFIGWSDTPVTHGLTFGELARYYQAKLGKSVDLQVVTMKGWRRELTFEETGLPWVPTSPHIPDEVAMHLYVATGMVGGVFPGLSEGVGTPQPFEIVGAPGLDEHRLKQDLEAQKHLGVRFRPCVVRPYYGKFVGKEVRGVQLHLEAPAQFLPLRTAVGLLLAMRAQDPKLLAPESEASFRKHWGPLAILDALKTAKTIEEVVSGFAGDEAAFAKERAKVLLY